MQTRLSFIAFFLAALAVQAAPPANDSFANAQPVDGLVTGSNAEATAEATEPAHVGTAALHSVWWKYTATADGLVEAETIGSDFDTRLAVYTGSSVNALTLIAANDDHSATLIQSRVVFPAAAGTVYYIAVDGFANQVGFVDLAVFQTSPPPNDNFAAANDLGSTLTATATAHNTGASSEPGEPVHAGHAADLSLWWKWTAPASGEVRIDTIGSTMDTLLSVYTGTSLSTLELVAENDDGLGLEGRSSVTIQVSGGVTYYIAADAFNGVEGDVTLNVTVLDTVDPPQNDNFAAAAALPGGISAQLTATNDHATRQTGEPAHAGNLSAHTVWWVWTPYTSGPARFSTQGSTFDTVLGIYTGTAVGALATVASNDDASPGDSRSTVTFPAVAGTSYFVAVGGYFADSGTIALSLEQTPVVPPNDAFAARTNLGTVAGTAATGVNLGATAQAGEPAHAGSDAARSVWWQWTSPVDEFITVTTAGSSFDTVLAVYTGSTLDGLSLIAADDDADPSAAVPVRTSTVSFFAPAGTPFTIAVDGRSGAAGAIALHIDAAPPPANDRFLNATALTGGSAVIDWSNYDATAEPGEPAHAGAAAQHSVWWKWTAPIDGVAILSTEGSGIDTRMAVYEAGITLSALTLVMANDDEPNGHQPWSLVRFRAHAGQAYLIALDGHTGAQGSFHLSLTELVIEVDNDRFASRASLGSAATVSASGTNIGASAESGEPPHRGSAAEASVWWQWTAPTTAWVRTGVATGDFNRRVAVYTGPGTSVASLAAVESVESGAPDPLSVNFHTSAGTVYFIAVDGSEGSEGLVQLTVGPGDQPQPPGNDAFADRISLSHALPVVWASGANTFATAEPGEPAHAGTPAASSAWFQWSPEQSGHVTLDGTAMAFDARIAVYTGSALNNLVLVAQSTAPGAEILSFTATAGVDYHIAIDANGSFAAGGSLAFTLDYDRPDNDAFAAATALSGPLPLTATGFNAHATAEPGEPAHAGNTASKSVWWRWTPAATGLVRIDTAGSEFDTVLAVYTGTSLAGLTLAAGSNHTGVNEVQFTATAGTEYLIAVDGFEGLTGGITLHVGIGQAPLAPANDAFAAATALGTTRPVHVTGTNVNASAEPNEPDHSFSPASHSVWWRWTAPVTADVTIDTIGSAPDTLLAVYTGASLSALALVAANDDATGGIVQSRVTFPAVAGTEYRIAVDGYSGGTGALALNLIVDAPDRDAFALWSDAAFPASTTASDRAVTADPDADGLPNGIEYLTGSNPAAADASASALVISRTTDATVLTYRRSSAVPAGFESLEASPSMAAWTLLSPATLSPTIVPGLPGQPDIVTVRVPDTLGHRYFRLGVPVLP